jgi:hypothetical protein
MKTKRIFTDQELKLVKSTAALGAGQEYIAKQLGMSTRNLQKRKDLLEVIAQGKAEANMKVRQSMYQMATSSRYNSCQFSAAKWWLAVYEGEIEPKQEIVKDDDIERPRLVVEEAASDEPNA